MCVDFNDVDDDGDIDDTDEAKEESPGAIVFENWDNDDGDAAHTPDKDETSVTGENDDVPLSETGANAYHRHAETGSHCRRKSGQGLDIGKQGNARSLCRRRGIWRPRRSRQRFTLRAMTKALRQMTLD